ncbi:hypothetical protein [Prosthecodimorpha staleyi]|uniref:DUF7210 domain-containing protein n=1 Tax=Prosthecodimorpha staleyi TaxID=2840188 RepID=A0A947D9X3_9HYPH|nr:hypothetical protein [Prosthecodimorpha staleyi]MBT9293333.1 hypothetical protein [Prosthecodimorpha staleyi]
MAKKPQPQPEAAAPPPAAAPIAADTLATLQGVTVPPGDLAADLAAPGRIVPAMLDQRPDNPEPGIQIEGSGVPPAIRAVTLIAPAIIDGRRREIGETVEVDETIAAQLAGAQAI